MARICKQFELFEVKTILVGNSVACPCFGWHRYYGIIFSGPNLLLAPFPWHLIPLGGHVHTIFQCLGNNFVKKTGDLIVISLGKKRIKIRIGN